MPYLGEEPFPTAVKGRGGLCLIWEGSLFRLQKKKEVGCLRLSWEGSLSLLLEGVEFENFETKDIEHPNEL